MVLQSVSYFRARKEIACILGNFEGCYNYRFQRGRKAGVPGEKTPMVSPIKDRVTYKSKGFTPDHAGNRTRALALVTAAVATSELVY